MIHLISKYKIGLGRLNKPVYNRIWSIFVRILCKIDKRLFCAYVNLRRRIQNESFEYDESRDLFYVTDQLGNAHYFKDPVRGSHLYWHGLKNRGDFLSKSYFLDKVNFDRDSVVIDCGANYGDLYLFLQKIIDAKYYFAVEPGEDEFTCLSHNAPDANLFQCGLGEKDELKEFFLNSADGDSSFVKPAKSHKSIVLRCRPLDDLIEELDIRKIKLLKIEAEGYEPEVLHGADFALSITEYVAVDAGPERGETSEITVVDVFNILFGKGFTLVDFNKKNCRALFVGLPQK